MKPASKWSDTFRYAAEGIVTALKSERNMKIHLLAAVAVLLAAAYFRLPGRDVALLLIVIGLVIAAELVNTALEAVVDLVSPDWHPLAKTAKDTAAGAVLVAAIIAVCVGCLLFYEPVMACFQQ
ncbi:diacylglycerol kinase family protein [Paenibacillus woosongensis]|uniref:Diacylglycerol kinase family protein n=1 Tax=Paenibacillus woosongensis TaxID=307580 RepID=A0AA95I5K9_9BACL|nr:diacylglycerol kinase family protein [Paenibacillus woosongensis]WHX47713.1 diacylglycerol kinase family protein [Paenibacillus woosongensis]